MVDDGPVYLALDTSTLTLSLALAAMPDGPVVDTLEQGPPSKQSELLPGAIGELLRRQGLIPKDLRGAVVGLGPGSFTGLRIGVATIKGLAYAIGFPVRGVSSLEAVAWHGPEGRPLLACALARKDELYVAPFRRAQGRIERGEADEAWALDDVARWLRENPQALALGPGANEYASKLRGMGVAESQLSLAVPFPRGEALFALGRLGAPATDVDSQAELMRLEPTYVRVSSAERNPAFPPAPGPAPSSRLRDP